MPRVGASFFVERPPWSATESHAAQTTNPGDGADDLGARPPMRATSDERLRATGGAGGVTVPPAWGRRRSLRTSIRAAAPCSRASSTPCRGDGHDVDNLSADVLAPIDHLHTFGLAGHPAPRRRRRDRRRRRRARRRLRHRRAGAHAGDALRLPTRRRRRDAPAFCEVAAELNRRSGLDDLIEIRVGDAMALPCEDAEFTVAWTQHASMNIARKAQMYGEMRRALVTGGRLAFFDVLAGRASTRPSPGAVGRRREPERPGDTGARPAGWSRTPASRSASGTT